MLTVSRWKVRDGGWWRSGGDSLRVSEDIKRYVKQQQQQHSFDLASDVGGTALLPSFGAGVFSLK